MKIAVISLGCKVNTCESESIATKLRQLGHTVVNEFDKADAYIINTCAVTQEAEKKSRQCVARVRKFNKDAKIYIIGCASEKNPDQFLQKDIEYIAGNANKEGVCNLPIGVNKEELPKVFENMTYSDNSRTRAFVKIQDGCNNFCSYCIIPYLRGRNRSRSIDDIICECNIKSLYTQEIVLTGINVSAYGEDIKATLIDLVKALSNVYCRIRFSSLEVNVISREFLEAMENAGNFCPHFHLSLQSGDDEVLKSMNRKYTRAEFIEKCNLIREYFPFAAITTDIIVGFSTETDEGFQNTYDLAKEIGFADIHVFPYSRRMGTRAYSWKLVDPSIIKEREQKLLALKQELKRNFSESAIGSTRQVLAEYKEGGFAQGYDEYYLRVYFDVEGEVELGKIYKVKITDLYRDGVKGVVINKRK